MLGAGLVELRVVLKFEQKLQGQRIPSSSCKRRRVAASMLSMQRGWLQQLLDQ